MDYKQQIEDFKEELIEIRREFHKIPEVGMEEYETGKKIAGYLRQWGLQVQTGVGKTGVVGLLKGKKDGKTIGIRADIDALPIREKTGLEFASQNQGVMHACGHDSHITIGLGAAKILSMNVGEIKGNVKFIFQPGEETLEGAGLMIADKVLEDPPVDTIVGLHNWPELESGIIGIKKGPIMAAADKFEIVIRGKGGHGAVPHAAVDSIVTASNIVEKLQQIISREVDPLQTGVVTVGTFNAGSAFNIIPDETKLTGTVRTFDSGVREFIGRRMEEIAAGVCKASRCEYDFNYIMGIPATDNDPQFTEEVINILSGVFGEDKLKVPVNPSMGGEDFALFQKKIPGTYFFLGTRNDEKGIVRSIHHPEYLIDEDILPIGVRAFCEIVRGYLN